MNILVTGGAGYIGSHAVQRLLADGHTVVVIDNLCNGHAEAIDLLRKSVEDGDDRLLFVKTGIDDRATVERALDDHGITAVMHFAALACVGESVKEPLKYHHNNTASATQLLESCAAWGVEKFVFSSTCATYGEPPADRIPIREDCPQIPINPYGWSKLHFERILHDYAIAQAARGKAFGYAALRYFNVAGSDRSGLIGEHHDPETHLIPLVLQAAMGARESITVFGTDYPTPDGTCVRDYIHVEDLIDAHVAVLRDLDRAKPGGDQRFYNLGIGKGYSVREVIETARKVTGKEIRVVEGGRRPGDPPTLFADPSKIRAELDWKALVPRLDDIIESAWAWMQKHPKGYGK